MLTRTWQHRNWLARGLWPISWLYGLLLTARPAARRTHTGGVDEPRAPVIVIGNVLAGGAGKTPVVIALARHLQSRGIAIGVISRGYGRISTGCREVQPGDPAEVAGDEPTLIRQIAGIPVFVAEQRQDAANELARRYPDTRLILSDDGLQHTGLHRALEICVFDDRGVGNGWLLPAGPLREPWPRPADLVLHTGNTPAFAGHRAYRRLARLARRSDGQLLELETFFRARSKPIMAIAGIAKPDEFFVMLQQLGCTPDSTLALPDHYNFDSFEANKYKGYDLICTEKDAIKLWRHAPQALAVPLRMEFDAAFIAAFDTHTDRLLGRPVSSTHGHTTS